MLATLLLFGYQSESFIGMFFSKENSQPTIFLVKYPPGIEPLTPRSLEPVAKPLGQLHDLLRVLASFLLQLYGFFNTPANPGFFADPDP